MDQCCILVAAGILPWLCNYRLCNAAAQPTQATDYFVCGDSMLGARCRDMRSSNAAVLSIHALARHVAFTVVGALELPNVCRMLFRAVGLAIPALFSTICEFVERVELVDLVLPF